MPCFRHMGCGPAGFQTSETQYSEKQGHNIQHPLLLFDAHIVTRVSEALQPTGLPIISSLHLCSYVVCEPSSETPTRRPIRV
ncbi:MAG: hypothetical protein QW724_02575 [Nitrososphaerota archaeon]